MVQLTEIRKRAKELGISGTKMKKDELIQSIQKAEGNFPCFKSAQDDCDQSGCYWREDCLSKK
ncbi:MAG: SAP domain-containing protein [Fibrobacter sp.]|nr:SAP domain-containing protein [Fibrobacter sp.]